MKLTVHSYVAAYLPSTSEADRRNPDISPFYANLKELKCPPAIFTCGTLDPLLDDSVLMATKWTMSGADAVLKLYPGMFRTSQITLELGVLDRLTTMYIQERPMGSFSSPLVERQRQKKHWRISRRLSRSVCERRLVAGQSSISILGNRL